MSCKAEYRKIAERRVRLGLVLAEIGRRANVSRHRAGAGRGDARRRRCATATRRSRCSTCCENNPNAQAQMRAPIFEEKVVDLILGKAEVTDKAVTKDELMAEDDLPEGYGEPSRPPRPRSRPRPRPRPRPPSRSAAAEATPRRRRRPRQPRPRRAPEAKPERCAAGRARSCRRGAENARRPSAAEAKP